jgi:hypothetical protein
VRRFLLACLVLFTASCITQPSAQIKPNGVAPLSEEEMVSVINKNTVKKIKYSGLYQIFQVYISILNSELQTATLRQRGAFSQWDQSQFQSEREKMLQENSTTSKFFVSFFTPEHEYDDLQKPKTIWKFFLDVSGQRLEGKVKKLNDTFTEMQTLHPFFDHFSTPYEVIFNIPMATVEKTGSKVILTSSLGSAEFDFPASK